MVKRLSDVPLLTTVPANAEVPLLVPNVLNGRIAWPLLAAVISGGVIQLRSGSGIPAPALGNVGDYYIDATNFTIYGPKVAAGWPTGTSMIGTNGTNGVDGSSVLGIAAADDGDGTITLTFDMSIGPDIVVELPYFSPLTFDAESLAISTTTSTAWQTKLTLAQATLPAGRYVVFANYKWGATSTGTDFEAQLTRNGAQVGEVHRQEPKDPSSGATDGQLQPGSFMSTFQHAGGAMTHELQWRRRPGSTNSTHRIASATMLLMRIA